MEGNGIKESDRTGWIRFLRGAWLGTYGWLLLAMVAVIPQALDPHIGSNVTRVIANTATLFFLTYILVVIFNDIFKTSRVTIDTLVGALCGYLLIAAMFAAVYSTVLLFDSSAFLIDSALGVDPANLHFQGTHFGVLTYYSIMTLTTVGYGDVVPASTISRGFVSIEAVIGQIYLTVIVARLVGMHLTASMK
jgi:voltage-gated potassium channel Kch